MTTDHAPLLAGIESLETAGDVDRALDRLVAAVRQGEDPALAAELLALRHRAFHHVEPAGPAVWPEPQPDHWPGNRIPEVVASELDASVVGAALQHHGSLLVRGLVDENRAAVLRSSIDRAFAGAALAREDRTAETRPDLWPFAPDPRYEFGATERAVANVGGGVMGVDSPTTMFCMIEAFEEAGVRALLTDYFGERPAFSVKKTTLRRTERDAQSGWHQDGAFLGTSTRALNIWTALSPCGMDAPNLDVFVTRFNELVPTGGPESYDWSVSDETASRYDLSNVVRPEFDTGDALLFDHLTLHRTGVDPAMTDTRYAIEMWFFAPTNYPVEQIPLLF